MTINFATLCFLFFLKCLNKKAHWTYAAQNGSEIFMYMGHSCINHAVIFKGVKCEVVGNLHAHL
jgi:hypothetical protein